MFGISRAIKAINLFRTSVSYAGNFPTFNRPLQRSNQRVFYSFSNGQLPRNPEETNKINNKQELKPIVRPPEVQKSYQNQECKKTQQTTSSQITIHNLDISQLIEALVYQSQQQLKIFFKEYWNKNKYMIGIGIGLAALTVLQMIIKYIKQKIPKTQQQTQQQTLKQEQLQAFFDKYMIGAFKERIIENPFRNYQCYTQIQKEIDDKIKGQSYYNNVLIIEGPPGIGKTTAVRSIISERMKNKHRQQNDNRDLEIYYIDFKTSKDTQLDEKQVEEKVNELELLLYRLYQRHKKNKQKNIILIIDEIDSMCKDPYKYKIGKWMPTLERMNVIGLSSYTQPTKYWIKSEYYFHNSSSMALQLNKTSQIFEFLKGKFNSINISDETLKIISSKYSTFRFLSETIFLFHRDYPNFKSLTNLSAEEINSTLINYFSVKIKESQVRKLQNLMEVTLQAGLKNTLIDEFTKQYNQRKTIFYFIAINQLFRFLGDEYKMVKGESNPFQVSNIQQIQDQFTSYRQHFADLKYFTIKFRSFLSLENYIFEFSSEQTCSRSQNQRQIVIGYIKNQLQKIEKMKNTKIPEILMKQLTIFNMSQ